MPSLNKIMDPSRPLAVVIGGETINLSYRPQFLTSQFEETILELQKARLALDDDEEKDAPVADDAAASVAKTETQMRLTRANKSIFLQVCEEWDLKLRDEDEAAIPLTEAGLRPVPHDIVAEVLAAILTDNSPNLTKESDSAGS